MKNFSFLLHLLKINRFTLGVYHWAGCWAVSFVFCFTFRTVFTEDEFWCEVANCSCICFLRRFFTVSFRILTFSCKRLDFCWACFSFFCKIAIFSLLLWSFPVNCFGESLMWYWWSSNCTFVVGDAWLFSGELFSSCLGSWTSFFSLTFKHGGSLDFVA